MQEYDEVRFAIRAFLPEVSFELVPKPG